MMVPHHESAIEMARVAQGRAEHEELRTLAAAIIAAQQAEIDQLKAWRLQWFGSDETPPMEAMPMLPGMDVPANGGHSMDGTMDMTADIEELRTAEPFDEAFIGAMIQHHSMAIDAADIVREATERPELLSLAEDVISAQQREIDEMESWRTEWYPG